MAAAQVVRPVYDRASDARADWLEPAASTWMSVYLFSHPGYSRPMSPIRMPARPTPPTDAPLGNRSAPYSPDTGGTYQMGDV